MQPQGKDSIRTQEILVFAGLRSYFDTVVTPDEAPGKPSPAGALLCLQRMRSSANYSFMIGDSINDLKTARAAGLTFAHATWGPLQSFVTRSLRHRR